MPELRKACTKCGSSATTRWYKDEDGQKSLCHSCGLKRVFQNKQQALQLQHSGATSPKEDANREPDEVKSSTPLDSQPKPKIETPSWLGNQIRAVPSAEAAVPTKQPGYVVLKEPSQPPTRPKAKRAADEVLRREASKTPRLAKPRDGTSANDLQRLSPLPDNDSEHEARKTSMTTDDMAVEDEQCNSNSDLHHVKQDLGTIKGDIRKLTQWVEAKSMISEPSKARDEKALTNLRIELQGAREEYFQLERELAREQEEHENLKIDMRNRQSADQDYQQIAVENKELKDENNRLQRENELQGGELRELRGKMARMQEVLR